MERTAIAIKEQDNVATAIKDIPAGQEAAVGIGEQVIIIPVTEDIAYGHKFALTRHYQRGDLVLKYNCVIGHLPPVISKPASTPMSTTWRVCAAEAKWTWTEIGSTNFRQEV